MPSRTLRRLLRAPAVLAARALPQVAHFGGRFFTVSGDPKDSYFKRVAANLNAQDRATTVLKAALKRRPGPPTVLDIGANIGLTALAIATVLPAGATLVVAEPSPRNLVHLRRNLSANRLVDVIVVEAAIGVECSESALHESADGAANHLVASHHVTADAMSTVPVRVTTLDAVVEAHGLTRVDFIKIDVEGAEADVLAGGRRTIERFRPVILLEFNAWTLIAFGNVDLRAFIVDLLGRFPCVLSFDDDDRLLPVVGAQGAKDFLHRVLVERRSVDDIVLCFDDGWISGG